MKTKDFLARDFCNIKQDLVIDVQERYNKDFQKYDGFIAGFDEANKWILTSDEKPEYREMVNIITDNSIVPFTACFDSIRDTWYYYDFKDDEWYEIPYKTNIIKWRYCFRS